MQDINVGPVLLDFWSPYCGPGKKLTPVIEEIEDDFIQVEVIKINALEDFEVAKKFKINALPTLIYLKDGKEVNRTTGLQTKEEITKQLNKIV